MYAELKPLLLWEQKKKTRIQLKTFPNLRLQRDSGTYRKNVTFLLSAEDIFPNVKIRSGNYAYVGAQLCQAAAGKKPA